MLEELLNKFCQNKIDDIYQALGTQQGAQLARLLYSIEEPKYDWVIWEDYKKIVRN